MRTPLLLLLALSAPLTDLSAQTVQIQEWPVPWQNSRPRDPYVGADGRVWFVGQTGNYAAVLDPENGAFRRYDLAADAGPHNLIVEPSGTVWYAGNASAHIGRLDPHTGAIERIAMPDPSARDPHTLIFDDAGDIWFTVQGGNFVGKLDRASSEVQLVPVPTQRARPYGIRFDPAGTPWIVLFGTNKLASVNPKTLELTEHALSRAAARPRRVEVTSDGMVWYVDYAQGFLGRYDPRTGAEKEWQLPGGATSRPYAMAADAQGRIWTFETGAQPNRIGGFDPRTEQFFGSTAVPSGGGAVRHMVYHAPSNSMWFGTDTGTIGRARLPQ